MTDLERGANAARGPASLLLVTHVPIRRGPRGPQIDAQTAQGIAQWCRHFGSVTYYGIAADSAASGTSAWVDAMDAWRGRARLVALPRAYRIGATLGAYRHVRRTLGDAIMRHRHLCFTFGGIVGDWPALAAREAIRQRRRYGAWIDRVEAPIIRNRAIGAPLQWRLAAAVAAPVGEHLTRYLIRNSAVALLQGLDTFSHYARHAPDPHCTYDTHTQERDRIDDMSLAAKRARALAGAPLRLVYVGRAAAMKGPGDWLDTLERLRARQVPFHAAWIGDGPELAAMRARVAAKGMSALVDLPGFEGDREVLLRRMRESDVLLFCHKTPESARCVIEALVSGCPIVGYETAYPRGLVELRGGGAFAAPGDVSALTERVAALHHDRAALARLFTDAAASGRLYDEDTVYAHRAALMKRA